jgi:hypothetical protein
MEVIDISQVYVINILFFLFIFVLMIWRIT